MERLRSLSEEIAFVRRHHPSEHKRWHTQSLRIPLRAYHRTFKPVLEGQRLPTLVTSERPLVIDFLAHTDPLAQLFETLPQTEKRGIAIAQKDWRSDEIKARDKRLGVEQLVGDLM